MAVVADVGDIGEESEVVGGEEEEVCSWLSVCVGLLIASFTARPLRVYCFRLGYRHSSPASLHFSHAGRS